MEDRAGRRWTSTHDDAVGDGRQLGEGQVNDHAGLERAPAGTRSTAEAAPAHALGVLRSADGARVRVPGMCVMTMRSRRRGALRMHDTLQAEAVDREGQQQEKAQQVSESLHAQFA